MSDRKSKKSKADIAKQFDLPERQSKITTLLNQAGQAYCICRSSDSSRFMIACDACEEWYHGDCINISEREAKYIKNYFCERCREEDPTLKTRFRPQKRENEEDTGAVRDDRKKKRKEKDHSENKSSKRPSNSGCGDCSGCLQLHDCGHCVACEDMHKYGGSNKLKMKCKQRVCVKSKKPSRQSSSNRVKKKHHERDTYEPEESISHLQTMEPRQCYGPQCIKSALYGSKYCSSQCGIRLATARIYQVLPQRIQEWSLSPCVAEQRNRKALEVVRGGLARAQAALRALDRQHAALDAAAQRAAGAVVRDTDEKVLLLVLVRKALEVVRGGLARAQAALRALDRQHAALDAAAQRAAGAVVRDTDEKVLLLVLVRKALEVVRGEMARAQAALRALDRQHAALDAAAQRAAGAAVRDTDEKLLLLVLVRKALEVVRGEMARAQAALRALDRQHAALDAAAQRAAGAAVRDTDEKLLLLVLVRKALEVVRGEMARAQAALRALDRQHAALDAAAQRAAGAAVRDTDEKEADDETSMYCITCGHEIHSRTAVKHMEKCFVKYEAQASFGSRHRTRIDGQSMFCDYYNPVNGTYCKRLRVMCPEHFKDPKVSDTDVCGCPLVKKLFEPTGEFCRAPKKSCLKHYQWEKLRRAEIDMERVRQWLRADELVEQERSIRHAMASRAGVLGLMLHSTYNHEVMERITGKANENGKLKEGS